MEIAQQTILEGGTIFLPQGVRVHAVDSDDFKEFWDEVSGLTANTILLVFKFFFNALEIFVAVSAIVHTASIVGAKI